VGSGAQKTCIISETVQDRTNVTMTDLYKVTHVLSIVAKLVTLDDLEQPKRHSCRNKKYRAHQKNLKEDRFILSVAKCRPMILFSRNIKVYEDIRGGSLGVGGISCQTTLLVVYPLILT